MALVIDFARQRREMVERQLAARGITDDRVLKAMQAVPRERFVPEALQEFAYEDSPLPIAADQTISQPMIVAQMIELARIGPDSMVLEVGAGSGYAAAVIGRIARQVHGIEWHADLAQAAAERIAALGYRNVDIRQGDGTLGLPDKAPFDAILVAAGGPEVPDSLRRQLSIGGRMVIPVAADGHQVLTVVRRTGEDSFTEEDHGLVMFVPLVGKYGWAEPDRRRARRGLAPATVARAGPEQRIAEAAEPFGDLAELSRLADRFADRRVVLLGEATHGTSEFYQARTWITERLVALHGFTVVAVEADWPDAAVYDGYVRRRAPAARGTLPFARFPRWMWRNAEVRDLLERLRAANEDIGDLERMAGFYGLDIYSLGASIDAVLRYLDQADAEAARIARERYACLTPWRSAPESYGRMALNARFASCEEAVSAMLAELLERRLTTLADGDSFFDATQNARIVAQAEAYYRAMYYGAADSWNLRDRHMFATLEALLAHRGPEAKAVVWAHNSHIGDATATDMGRVRGEINIGQLVRERYGEAAALVGFGTDRGTVAAASRWDGPMEVKRVRTALPSSWEAHSRDSRIPAFLLDLGPDQRPAVREDLAQGLRERAIGVIYRPENELASHYFFAELARQFDAWIWFEETKAVDAAPAEPAAEPPETYPFGL